MLKMGTCVNSSTISTQNWDVADCFISKIFLWAQSDGLHDFQIIIIIIIIIIVIIMFLVLC
jgi:hypothetical protein